MFWRSHKSPFEDVLVLALLGILAGALGGLGVGLVTSHGAAPGAAVNGR
jgi:hypothetical protein